MPSIQLRHDTSTNWTTYNPILLEGEVGVETDTNKIKIGDGTTAYNSLDYFGGDVDLSNYYNKTQTDALLVEKQNVFQTGQGLDLSVVSNIHGYNFIDEDTIVATSTDSTIQHIDIPYNPNSGQVVSIPSNFQIAWASSFGYYNSSNEYVPVIYNFHNDNGYLSFTYLDGNGTPQSSGKCPVNYGEMSADNLLQYFNGTACAMFPYFPPANKCFFNKNSISNAETAKINVCRLVSTDTTTQYKVSDFGLYTIGTYLAMSTGTWHTAKDNPNQFTIRYSNVMKVAVDNSTIVFDSNGALSAVGGSSVTVDQTYDATSTNAQSGTAVAEAISDCVQNAELVEVQVVVESSAVSSLPSFYKVFSDGTCIQGGNCTSGTAVTFLKEFANTSYINTCSASTSSTTGFTPSATGSYIVVGKVNLTTANS